MSGEIEALWQELKEHRARHDELRDQVSGDRVVMATMQGDVSRLLIMTEQAEKDRAEFRVRVESKLDEVTETKGAKAAAKWLIALLLSGLGLATAWLGWGHKA